MLASSCVVLKQVSEVTSFKLATSLAVVRVWNASGLHAGKCLKTHGVGDAPDQWNCASTRRIQEDIISGRIVSGGE